MRRLSGRTTCDVCQRPFFGREPGETCAVDGHEPQGTLVRRKDDEPDAIRKRLQVYRDQTAPVIDWYATHGGNARAHRRHRHAGRSRSAHARRSGALEA